jgi:protein arginine kinase
VFDAEAVFTQVRSAWLGRGPNSDIVVSSRIRLARNLADLPFPSMAGKDALAEVLSRVRRATEHLPEARRYQFLELGRLSPLDRQVLIEKHLISPEHAREPEGRGVVLRDDEAVSIMVNEEDHIRLQVLLPGLDLDAAWQTANRLDDSLEQQLDFAFDEKLGFLTACPTNLGSGLRASIMVHLPALVLLNQAGQVFTTLSQLGVVVRGLYGEGTQALGNLFQISNQLTLNQSEEDLISNLLALVGQVMEQERAARSRLYQEFGNRLVDMVWRAYGTLTSARILTGDEAMKLLSDVRLGVTLNLLPQVDLSTLNRLLILTRPGFIQRVAGQQLPPAERDVRRAAIVREELLGKNK